jgi:Tfp pilus assembly protein PilF
MVAAGAAQAQADQDCQNTTLTAEARQAACDTARAGATAQEGLAMGYLDAGRPEDALAAARRAVELDPMYGGGHAALVAALVATGAVDEAIAAYREAQAAGVEDDSAGHMANNLAWGLYMAGEHETALPIIEEWLAAHPEPTGGEYYLNVDTSAHILAALGREEEALQAFLRADALGGAEARNYYTRDLTALGFAPEPGDEGFEAALRACVATGEACKLFPQ